MEEIFFFHVSLILVTETSVLGVDFGSEEINDPDEGRRSERSTHLTPTVGRSGERIRKPLFIYLSILSCINIYFVC